MTSGADPLPSPESDAAVAPPSFPRPAAGLPPHWYFGPGPSQLHPLVPETLARAVADGLPSVSHRSARFRDEVARTREALTALLHLPDGYRICYLGSATEAMERIVQGAVARRSFHLVNGSFSRRFRKVSVNLGRETDVLEAEDGKGFRLERVEVPHGTELVALTLNETSTGVALDLGGMEALAVRHPEVLVAVDGVSGTPALPVPIHRVDALFFSVQKLFGMPAGLGVLIVSPRMAERSLELKGRGVSVGGYLHLPALVEAADQDQTVATPNALAIHLLGRVTEAFLDDGLDLIRAETERKASLLLAAGAAAGWEPFVAEEDRSSTVLVFRVPGGSEATRSLLAERGFQVGSGYGPYRTGHVRIANFPAHSVEAVEALAGAIREGVG
jgi:phosphoserine aminotransferase